MSPKFSKLAKGGAELNNSALRGSWKVGDALQQCMSDICNWQYETSILKQANCALGLGWSRLLARVNSSRDMEQTFSTFSLLDNKTYRLRDNVRIGLGYNFFAHPQIIIWLDRYFLFLFPSTSASVIFSHRARTVRRRKYALDRDESQTAAFKGMKVKVIAFPHARGFCPLKIQLMSDGFGGFFAPVWPHCISARP